MQAAHEQRIEKIVSGGQTGVDRAALDAGLALAIPIAGWCPRGRRAEDGVIDACYDLVETPSEDYAQRTEWNVRDSDATLILCLAPITGGTRLTAEIADRLGRPRLLVDLDHGPDADAVRRWLAEHDVKVLNVAGPRESLRTGVYELARATLLRILGGSGT